MEGKMSELLLGGTEKSAVFKLASHEKRGHVSNMLWHPLTNKQANEYKICIDKFSSNV